MFFFATRDSKGYVKTARSSKGARIFWETKKRSITTSLIASAVFAPFSPMLSIGFGLWALKTYFLEVDEEFFAYKSRNALYKTILKPQLSFSQFFRFGYRVYPEELEDHITNIMPYPKKLARKQRAMQKVGYRQIGKSIDLVKTHLGIVGTTGSGKTQTILTIFVSLIQNGNGAIYIDGKSDTDIENILYSIAKHYGYETQFKAIILNKIAKRPLTNTLNPLYSYPTAKNVKNFLSSLDSSKGGENSDYFKARSVLMLYPVMSYFKLMQLFYGKTFSTRQLADNTTVENLIIIFYNLYGIALEIEERIKELKVSDTDVAEEIEETKKTIFIKNPNLGNYEAVEEILNRDGTKAERFATDLNIDLYFFMEILNTIHSLKNYLKGLLLHEKFLDGVEAFYEYFKYKGLSFLYDEDNEDGIGIVGLEEMVYFWKNELIPFSEKGMFDNEELSQAFHEILEKKGIDELGKSFLVYQEMNSDMQTQHGYSIQNWGNVFDTIGQFASVLDVPNPDINGDTAISNGQIVYVMLPVMELEDNEINILGSMIIMLIKSTVANLLGGEMQSNIPIQIDIQRNKIKPNPLYYIFMDEVRKYMHKAIPLLLSQVRSLNTGMAIATQDIVSFNIGTDSVPKDETIANLKTFFLMGIRPENQTSILDNYIPEVEVVKVDNMFEGLEKGKLLAPTEFKIVKEKLFKINDAVSWRNGFGLFLGTDAKEPVYCQTYFNEANDLRYPILIRKGKKV